MRPRRFPARATRTRVRRVPGVMNKTEAAYAQHLDTLKAAGVVDDWWFEAMTFKLADDTRYTPDFAVVFDDGRMELHEVKPKSGGGRGAYYARDDAKVKVKLCARLFPFPVVVVYPERGFVHWNRLEIGATGETKEAA